MLAAHSNARDLTNLRFGRLTAVSVVGRSNKRSLLWVCECDCGNTVTRISSSLLTGKTKSCGCNKYSVSALRKRSITNRVEDAADRKNFRHCKSGATYRGHNWELSYDKFCEITKLSCKYCGAKDSKCISSKFYTIYRNGIDRIDNSIGYTEDNIVPCCKTCNYMKRDLSINDFLSHVRQVVTYSKC